MGTLRWVLERRSNCLWAGHTKVWGVMMHVWPRWQATRAAGFKAWRLLSKPRQMQRLSLRKATAPQSPMARPAPGGLGARRHSPAKFRARALSSRFDVPRCTRGRLVRKTKCCLLQLAAKTLWLMRFKRAIWHLVRPAAAKSWPSWAGLRASSWHLILIHRRVLAAVHMLGAL